MEIKTKFDLDANVWVIHKNKAKKGKITEICVRSTYEEPLYQITFESDYCFKSESEIFASKEQLLSYVASE